MNLINILKNKYFKATGLYTIGSIFDKAISLLLLPIFTRLLSTESYGVVSTYNSWVTITFVIISMQLFSSLRTAFDDYNDRLDEYVSAINGLIFLSFLVISAFAITFCVLFVKNVSILLVVFCLVQSYMYAIMNVETQRAMMALEYFKRTVLLSIPNFIAALLGIIVLTIDSETDYYGRIVPMVFVYAVFGITIFVKNYKRGRVFFNKEMWKYGLVFSTPLILHGLASTVLSTVDRTMLTSMRSASETGIYSVAYTLGMAVIVITTALESVWIPWFTKKMNEGSKNAINVVAKKYVLLVSTCCVIAMLCLPEILKLFTEKSFWDGISLIPPIVLASYVMFLYSISVNLEYYMKATNRIAINTIIAAGLNIALNIVFIPKFGAVAAAYTTVASYSVSFILHYLYAKKLDKELFGIKTYLIPIVLVILGTIITYMILPYAIIRWLIAIGVIFVVIIWFTKDREIKELISVQ